MRFLTLLTLILAFLWLPATASAQILACTGVDCNFCSLVTTIDNIIDFVIQLAVVLATIMLAITGFKMVASKGNPGAMQAAKDLLMNICIGVLLILAAWTLVDTLMKLLVSDQIVAQYGPWYDIDGSRCGSMLAPGNVNTTFETPGVSENNIDLGRDALGIAVQGSSVSLSGVNANPGLSSGSSGSAVSLSGGSTAPVRACNSADLRTINFLGSSVTIHKNFVASAQRIDQRWRARGGDRLYRVTSVGGYSCRNIAGSSRYSAHAYGLAIDINPAQNPHTFPPRGLVTNMPAEFVNLFIFEGWGWGGNWSSSKDAMHFSKSSGEGGNMRGD